MLARIALRKELLEECIRMKNKSEENYTAAKYRNSVSGSTRIRIKFDSWIGIQGFNFYTNLQFFPCFFEIKGIFSCLKDEKMLIYYN